MKIALYGGSFNPPHLGHVSVVRYLLSRPDIQEVWVLPADRHPFGKDLIPFEDRKKLCELAFEDFGSRVKILPIEKEEKSLTGYTVDTLRFLKGRFPTRSFVWVMGSELMRERFKWKDFEEVQKLAEIIEIPRVEEGEMEASDGKLSPFPNISSTQIRRRLQQGKKVSENLPHKVFQWIQQKGLYR